MFHKLPPSPEALIALIHPELSKIFKPAFLGRLTIVPYFALDKSKLKQIADLQLNRIQQRVKQHYGTELQFTPSFIEQLIAQCQYAETGARHMDQWLTDRLLPVLSSHFLTQIIDKKMPQCVTVELNAQDEIMCK